MSFIYENDELVKFLVKEGADFKNKYAQTPGTPVSPKQEASYQLAKKLLIDLQRQIDPADAPPTGSPLEVPPEIPAEAQALKVENLRTLGDFLQWAANNKLAWKGKRLAWTEAQVSTEKPPEDAWLFQTWKINRERDAETREPVQVTAYARKPELVDFLTFLRDSPEAKNNKVFQVMLNKIISQTNEFLDPKEQINPKATPEAKTDLNPEMIVDALPSDTLDLKNPLAGITGYPTFDNIKEPTLQLKVKDLNDLSSFSAWLRYKKILVPNSKGVLSAAYALNPDGDACAAVHILYKRAQYLSSVAAGGDKVVPNYSKAVGMYLKKVQELGRNFKGADGNSCAVVTPGTTASENAPEETSGKPGVMNVSYKGVSSKTIDQFLDKMALALPLSVYDLDFHRISYFFGLYKQLLEQSNNQIKGEVETAISLALTAMSRASSLTVGNISSFNMFAGPSEVVQWLQPPQGDKYLSFLAQLKTVIDNTRRVIYDFYASYKDVMGPETKMKMEAQVLGENSVYKSNWNKVRSLEARINEVIKFK